MPRFSEETLSNWTRPPSDTEENKLSNAERLVREAVNNDQTLSSKSIQIFGQGSYANDTNVRLNSDIDINIMFDGGFFYDIPHNKSKEDFGLGNSIDYSFLEFKNDIENALVNKFGRNSVERNNKCITVKESPTRVRTDVVPTWKYKKYFENAAYYEGICLFPDGGTQIIGYPKTHIENGKAKNANTQKRFKRLTRIFRKLRYKMIEDNETVSSNITSFLLECLVWNVPNNILNNYDTWTDRLRQSIIHLYNATKAVEGCKEWGEVSERIYLFHSGRKWTREDVNSYMIKLWNYLEFK